MTSTVFVDGRRTVMTRIAAGLSTPTGIVIIVPLLVLATGVAVWWSGATHIGTGVRKMIHDRFADQARAGRDRLREHMVEEAEVLQELVARELAVFDGEPPPAPFAHRLRALVAGRPGVAWLAVGFDDGTYLGVYVDDAGELVFSERRLDAADQTMQRDYRFGLDGSLQLDLVQEDSGYDPRSRPWYQRAIAADRRIWTAPYVFYDSGLTGVSCAVPWTGAGGRRGVISVDFHVNTLSALVARLVTLPGAQMVMFDEQGHLLAHPRAVVPGGRARRGRGELLQIEDVDDAKLQAFYDAWRDGVFSRRPGTVDFRHGGEECIAYVADCPIGQDHCWHVVLLAPLARYAGPLREHGRSAIVHGVVALVVAIVIAVLFARHVTRSRRDVVRARAQAQAAEDLARSLGSYRLIEKLGTGGMGEVWRARHHLLAFPAAIKLIHRDSLRGIDEDETARVTERFVREAGAIAALHSPHTIRLFDFGRSADGRLYYAMELLDGIDIENLVLHHGAQPAGRVQRILQQVCGSLAEAHDQGIVHRDIKPANIYLCRQGGELDMVKVLDFGLVRRTDLPYDKRLTFDGTVQGTPAYMAPEQISDQGLSSQIDVYALGCVAFWLLSGRQPFPDGKTMDVLLAHLNDSPPSLRELVPATVPDALCDLVMRCLAKDPDRRPPGMRALRRALAAIAVPDEQAWDEDRAAMWWEALPSLHGDPRETDAQLAAQDRLLVRAEVVPTDRAEGVSVEIAGL